MSTPMILRNYVSGEFISSEEGLALDSLNPSMPGEVVAVVPISNASQVSEAVGSADAAWGAWRSLPGSARADHLYA